VACVNCGPYYELHHNGKTEQDIHHILSLVSTMLEQGKIIAMKGMGGFHMACDARNEEAVNRLREMKNRDGKPFAVMFKSIGDLREYTFTSPEEEALLFSWKRPIVILKEKKKLAYSVSNGFNTIGSMLPYMPFHHLLFEHLHLPVIVLTSGNISDEPIVIDNDEAMEKLSPISDALITYNRSIFNRTDDSVIMVVNNKERLIRRSRGYVPSPVRMNLDVDGILATGAELVNCHCIGKGTLAFLSQHIGDLKNIETLDFYAESISHFKKLFRVEPSLVAADMHPDYLSTRYAGHLGLQTIHVQHHHAHIASCMAEHGLDEKVIGVSFDGTGLGDDGCIWGGEFMVCDLSQYQRFMHFDYVPMPGGDKAIEEPWRMALSYLYKAYGTGVLDLDLPFLSKINKNEVLMLIQMIGKKINSPMTSSAGRLFDAVSALLNLCTHATFHAEAPMRLENIMDHSCTGSYPFVMNATIHFEDMFQAIVQDLKDEVKPSFISAKFHHTIINSILAAVNSTGKEYRLNKVVLSGGTFQNRVLLEQVENLLSQKGFEVYTHSRVPSNDGGIALGQLAIAAKKRSLSCV
jgi:hydrogenase maturation protein HypF